MRETMGDMVARIIFIIGYCYKGAICHTIFSNSVTYQLVLKYIETSK